MKSRLKTSIASVCTLCALSMALYGCDKPGNEPSVNTSKSEADAAASSAMNAARAAAVSTGEALKDTAVAAKHEADAAIVKTQEAASSGDVKGTIDRMGQDAKNAVSVAADKTRDMAQDAKQKVDQKSN
jgi:hypothetical protein